jgi:FLYWCH zinc finger domain/MULE transposase domain
MPLHFVQSQKGRKHLVLNGFRFVLDKCRNEKKYYVCTEYRRKTHGMMGKCPATAQTSADDGELLAQCNNHNHIPDIARIKAKSILEEMKERARTSTENPQHIIKASIRGVSTAVYGALPRPTLMTRTIQNARQKARYPISNPLSLSDLVIPPEYANIGVGFDQKQFLMFDSGPESGDNRILLFSTRENLDFLNLCPSWFADGTFRVTPPLYREHGQLYTIHGKRDDTTIVLVFALIPCKTQEIYSRLLAILGNLMPGMKPEVISTDFESAAINAFAEFYPDSVQHGCFFHFG